MTTCRATALHRLCSLSAALSTGLLLVAGCATTETSRRESFFTNAVPFRGGTVEARELVESGNLDGAIAQAEALVATDPNDVAGWYSLGSVRAAKADYAGANAALERCLELDASHAAAWNNLGLVRAHLGKIDASEAAFRKAAALRGEDTAPWVNLAWLMTQRGRFADAVTAYDEALFRDPQDAVVAVAHGAALVRSGRYKEAAESLTASQATYGETVAGLVTLSTALRQMGELAEAATTAARAVALDGQSPTALLAAALAQDTLDVPESAESLYRQALEAAEKDGTLLDKMATQYNWACFLDEQKRSVDAEVAFRRFLEIAPPESPERVNVELRLERKGEEKAP